MYILIWSTIEGDDNAYIPTKTRNRVDNSGSHPHQLSSLFFNESKTLIGASLSLSLKKRKMCPLRLILIFLSATLAGFFVLKNLKSQPQILEDPSEDSANATSVSSAKPDSVNRSTKVSIFPVFSIQF